MYSCLDLSSLCLNLFANHLIHFYSFYLYTKSSRYWLIEGVKKFQIKSELIIEGDIDIWAIQIIIEKKNNVKLHTFICVTLFAILLSRTLFKTIQVNKINTSVSSNCISFVLMLSPFTLFVPIKSNQIWVQQICFCFCFFVTDFYLMKTWNC